MTEKEFIDKAVGETGATLVKLAKEAGAKFDPAWEEIWVGWFAPGPVEYRLMATVDGSRWRWEYLPSGGFDWTQSGTNSESRVLGGPEGYSELAKRLLAEHRDGKALATGNGNLTAIKEHAPL